MGPNINRVAIYTAVGSVASVVSLKTLTLFAKKQMFIIQNHIPYQAHPLLYMDSDVIYYKNIILILSELDFIFYIRFRPFLTAKYFREIFVGNIFLRRTIWEKYGKRLTVQKCFFLFFMAGSEGVSIRGDRGSR